MLNAYWEPLTFEVASQRCREASGWRRCIDTAARPPGDVAQVSSRPAPCGPYLRRAAAVAGAARVVAAAHGRRRIEARLLRSQGRSTCSTRISNTLAQDLVADGKGLLAADETVSTLSRRLLARGIESTPDSRRAYREMLFSTRGIGECISGVILHEETIRQRSAKGRTFPELLAQQGILSGIKVDRGRTRSPVPRVST